MYNLKIAIWFDDADIIWPPQQITIKIVAIVVTLLLLLDAIDCGRFQLHSSSSLCVCVWVTFRVSFFPELERSTTVLAMIAIISLLWLLDCNSVAFVLLLSALICSFIYLFFYQDDVTSGWIQWMDSFEYGVTVINVLYFYLCVCVSSNRGVRVACRYKCGGHTLS